LVTLVWGISLEVKSTRQEILDYWTPERMASAIPRDIVMRIFNGTYPVSTKGKAMPDAKLSLLPPSGTNIVTYDYGTTPYKQVGKVFFSDGTYNYVCSGSAVGKSVVLTAGHCVADTNKWMKNWAFVPQYKSNQRPFGTFTSVKMLTFDEWFKRSDFGRDVAFVVVSGPDTSKTLEDTVGKLGFITDIPQTNSFWALTGYPQAPPFDGSVQVQTYDRQIVYDDNAVPNTRGVVSSMTGGCSGGPWVYNIDIGNQNSDTVNAAGGLNSYGYQGYPYLFSPYFDSDVYSKFEEALSS